MNHAWKLDEQGDPDTCAVEVVAETTEHSGPRCTVCGFYFCIHCAPDAWSHECPGPPPEGADFDWTGNGTGQPPATPELWPRPVR